jgi:hypothetical protein
MKLNPHVSQLALYDVRLGPGPLTRLDPVVFEAS